MGQSGRKEIHIVILHTDGNKEVGDFPTGMIGITPIYTEQVFN